MVALYGRAAGRSRSWTTRTARRGSSTSTRARCTRSTPTAAGFRIGTGFATRGAGAGTASLEADGLRA